jgi:RNA recognition motif-containing protein
MSTKLFVGGLPYSVTDAELSDFFGRAGTVTSARVIMDRETGRSRGFGFVEMSSPEEAQQAISMYNNADMGGRTIVVNEAQPPRDGGDRGGRRDFGGRGGSRY